MARPRQIVKLQSSDPIVNRLQDQLMATLNPVLREMPEGIGDLPTITGSKGGNAALANLISKLELMGLIVDDTT